MTITSNTTKDKAFRAFLPYFFSVVCVFSSSYLFASDSDEGTAAKKFNAGEMITHHISDAHSIHFFGHVSVPLPCIVKTDNGFDFFMSSVFNDEHHEPSKTYHSTSTGNTYALHHEKIYVVETGEHQTPVVRHDSLHLNADSTVAEHGPVAEAMPEAVTHEFHGTPVTDFSITKSVFGMLMILGLVIFLFTRVAKAYQKRKGQAPKGMQNLLEVFVLFIKDEVAMPALGKKKTARYLPFLLSMFFFIWCCNLLGLVPFLGGFNITGTLSITMVMAAMVFIITTISGNAHYWGHIVWPPGVPFAVKIILVPIEIASVLIKPTVLMIRLTANINAGHIVILALTSLIFIFGEKGAGAGLGVGIASTLFMVFMFFIELLVAFLQAYVFTLLAALYFGDATQEHHHEEAHVEAQH
ncbi:MAG: F0F1 ATP synthase subunit A [Flavobacteriales bacterium]